MELLQELWFNLYKDRNPLLVTAVFSFLMHGVAYYLAFIPYLLCDHIQAFHKYKIQKAKENTNELLWKCLKGLLFNQFCVQLPLQLFFHPIAEHFGMEIVAPFPSWKVMASQVLLFMFMEDFYHYWMHRLLHFGPFYKYIHKQHHEFTAPFGITAEYAHPAETLFLGLGTIGGPLVYVYFTKNLHLITVLAWVTVRIAQTIEAHSGYDFPWGLRHILPIWAGADFHDHHHMVFLGNYSSTFRHWDWIFGTDRRYRLWKQSLKGKQEQSETAAVQKEE